MKWTKWELSLAVGLAVMLLFCAARGTTLPLRWLLPATLLWTCHLGTPCVASCSQPTSKIWLDLKFLFSYP